jgi:hypothetical protein
VERLVDQEVIRAMIMHENEIINDRLTWLLTFQGLLLASLGFAWGAKGSKPLVRIFAGLGIVVSVVSVFGLLTATNAMYGLVDWWSQHRPADYAGPDVIGASVPLRWPRVFRYLTPWNLFPLLFVVAWIAIHRASERRASDAD